MTPLSGGEGKFFFPACFHNKEPIPILWGKYMTSLLSAAFLAAAMTRPQCLLQTDHNGEMVTITAIVSASGAANGQYRIAISKKSSSGQAQSVSSGNFSVSGQRKILSVQTHNLPAGGKIEAVLTLMVDGKQLQCRKTLDGDSIRL